MPLASSDLLAPAGEIEGAMFYPSLSPALVASRVDTFLAQGYANADVAAITDPPTRDRIARTFAYYRAWSDVVNRITLTPASTSLAGEVATSMLQSQIDQWIVGRDRWLAAYEVLVPSAAPTTPINPVSRTLPTRIVF